MVYCNRCGTKNRAKAKYCKRCGKRVDHPPFFWRIWQRRRDDTSSPVGLAETGGGGFLPEDREKNPTTNRTLASETHLGPSAKLEEPLTEVVTQRSNPQSKEGPAPDRTLDGLLTKIRELEKDKENLRTAIWKNQKRPSAITGSVMAVVGALCLILSAAFTSTVLAFIGLGLAFWGALLLFIRPQKYVRSDLMDSTALSSLIAIDRVITGLGFNEKGVYIPTGNPDKAVVFIPSQTLERIPTPEEIERQRFSKDAICKHPDGITLVPPGVGLANLFERELGVEFSKCSLETLAERLPRLLIEDLEMVRDFEMHVDGNNVQFKFVESIYSDFCNQLRGSTNVCSSVGCPVCSAMACILAQASGKSVSFDCDKFSQDGRITESSYRILEG